MKNLNLDNELYWTPQAQAKLKMIPFFARPQARHRIEEVARAAGLEEVTTDIVEQVRAKFGQ
ncbi:MAG: PCP reductase family protein [Cyanobacteria bacterium P01_A01_bin.40]